MASPAQITANQTNAKKSTGPKTESGKAKSSLNRLSHGFASNARFIKDEDPEEFYALLTDLTNEYHPATPTEQILVEKMAHNQWVSLRAIRLQGNMLGRMSVIGDVRENLPLLIRYQSTADRAFHRAHAELVKAQKQREKSGIGFESQKVGEPLASSAKDPVAPPQEPEKPIFTVVQPRSKAAHHPRFASIEEEIDWVMNASIDEIKASGL